MVNFNEYQKWEGSIAVPITDCYNLIVEESEKVSPEDVSLDFANYLYKIIDIKNLNGNDDVETMKSNELRDFYYDFGPKQAISEYITHIGTTSYVIELNEKVRLLALNDDKNGNARAGITEELFCWFVVFFFFVFVVFFFF